MKKNKVTVIWGEATIDAPGKITVKASKTPAPKDTLGPGSYQAKHIIVATGARPRVLPGLEPDKKLVWTYFEAMNPDKMPKSLLVVGSGAIGIEFASFYRTMGAEVTVVEVLPQILPVEDAEIAAFARKQFEKQGIKIMSGAKVTKLDKKADSVTATIDDGKGKTSEITVDRVIAAVGVVGNVENIGLEKLGVKIERGTIAIDGFCKTNVPGIYAIGDVAGPPMLAHKAEHEGVICVEAIKGLHPHPMDKRMIPGCTYCAPQVASVGLTEQAAKDKKLDVRVGRFPVHRQRQGRRARRGPGHGQDDLRQEDRPAARRASGRPRGDRTDPGLRGGDESRNHRRRADAHDLPASDLVGDDEGIGARRLRTRAEHVTSAASSCPSSTSTPIAAPPRPPGDRFGVAEALRGTPVGKNTVTNYRGLPAVSYHEMGDFELQQETCAKAGITGRIISTPFAAEVMAAISKSASLDICKAVNDGIAGIVARAPGNWGTGHAQPAGREPHRRGRALPRRR